MAAVVSKSAFISFLLGIRISVNIQSRIEAGFDWGKGTWHANLNPQQNCWKWWKIRVGFEPEIKITSLSVPRSTQSPGKCPHFDRHFGVIHR
jgi:hypothetical protein